MVKFWNSCISEWEGQLTLHKGDGSRSFMTITMTMTIWWPRSGVWIYQIVIGVTSVVGMQSNHLFQYFSIFFNIYFIVVQYYDKCISSYYELKKTPHPLPLEVSDGVAILSIIVKSMTMSYLRHTTMASKLRPGWCVSTDRAIICYLLLSHLMPCSWLHPFSLQDHPIWLVIISLPENVGCSWWQNPMRWWTVYML